MLPNLHQTKELYDFIAKQTGPINERKGLSAQMSVWHYQNVALVAMTVAKYANLDVHKAYILGLLHDYGEYIENTVANTFHGTAGYDEMMNKGFDEVARTCLSHSFFDYNFSLDEFPAYNQSEIIRAAGLLKKQGFDDYDKLVYLADMMSPMDIIDTIENRVKMIVNKYHISPQAAQKKQDQALSVKKYFDDKCGKNIYTLLGL